MRVINLNKKPRCKDLTHGYKITEDSENKEKAVFKQIYILN